MLVTAKEHEELIKNKPAHVEKSIAPDIQKQEGSKIEYVLMYPDNVVNNYHTGVYKVELPEGIQEVEINNGLVKTRDVRICETLKAKGFIFIGQREVNDEQ